MHVCVWRTRERASTHGGFGHLTSCRLISPYSAQMACDYIRLSRDYSAAEIERETERVKKINGSNGERPRRKAKLKNTRYVGSKRDRSIDAGRFTHQGANTQRNLLHTNPFNCISFPLFSLACTFAAVKPNYNLRFHVSGCVYERADAADMRVIWERL